MTDTRINLKKCEDNVAVYHIFFTEVITNRLIYAIFLILLIYIVLFHLMNRYFCYPILKTTCFVTTVPGNVQNMTSAHLVEIHVRVPNLYITRVFCAFRLTI